MSVTKPKYGLFSNLRYLISQLSSCSGVYTAVMFLSSPVAIITSYLGVYLPSAVVSMAETGKSPSMVVSRVAILSFALLITTVLDKVISVSMYKFMMLFDVKVQTDILSALMKGDYEVSESPDGLTRLSKAMENCGTDNRGARLIAKLLSSLLAGIIGALTYSYLLYKFDWRILIAAVVTSVGSFFIMKKCADWTYKNKDAWKTDDRKLNYLLQNAGDFSKAKDIRLYGLAEWFSDIFRSTLIDRMKWSKREQLYNFRADWLRALMSIIRDVLSYGLVVYVLSIRGMSGSDFVYYFGIVGGVTMWLSGIARDFSQLHTFSLGFSELREYLNYPSEINNGEGIKTPDETFSIEFRNVCYRYKGNDADTIKNMSFKIKKGEKLAVVGVNGAGKTTLVKLICGLYTQTSGEILIDGNPINSYDRKEYYKLFSVVFQDICVIPQSIRINIAAGDFENIDDELMRLSIERAGLAEKIASLPKGLDTRLIKSVYEDGIDMSGGEMQKLALARALYKGGKALILDEPTAALDPIAESNVYMSYNEMTEGHTSIFISHRLASTRFCDRILLIDNGEILEEGTHESLMRENGKYSEMFSVQSNYYKEVSNDDDA